MVFIWASMVRSRLRYARFLTWLTDLLIALPFLIRTELLLSPLLPLFTGYILTLLGFNVAKHVLEAYFGS